MAVCCLLMCLYMDEPGVAVSGSINISDRGSRVDYPISLIYGSLSVLSLSWWISYRSISLLLLLDHNQAGIVPYSWLTSLWNQSILHSLSAQTEGGNSDGAPCVFPFYYKNSWHVTCITDSYDRPWCSTTENYGQDKKWGECQGRITLALIQLRFSVTLAKPPGAEVKA